MPGPRADEIAALRNVAFVAKMFLTKTADRENLADAVASWERATQRLSRRAFSAPTRQNGVGGRGGYALQLGSQSTSEGKDGLPEQSKDSNGERSEPRTSESKGNTWIRDYLAAYRAAYRENATRIAVNRMARTFRRLEIQYPRNEVVRRFTHYVNDTPLRFYSVESFASRFGAYKEPVAPRGGPPDALPGESVDAYTNRLIALGF